MLHYVIVLINSVLWLPNMTIMLTKVYVDVNAFVNTWAGENNTRKSGFHPDTRGCWASGSLYISLCALPNNMLLICAMRALIRNQKKWAATARPVMSAPWTAAVLMCFCRWEKVVSKPFSHNSPALGLEKPTRGSNPPLENAVEEKYLTWSTFCSRPDVVSVRI